jgi:sugar phosphate isomerase/epimerase
MANPISASSAPVAGFGDKEYWDLIGTLEVMKRIYRESVVDGFELQLEPEWDSENPPLTDADWADWTKTPKYTAEEIVKLLSEENLPILSVHASRDVGNYLCSEQKREWEKAKRVIHDSLWIAERLGAEVCVFHLWNTRKTSVDLQRAEKIFLDVASRFSKVKASVENIPTHMEHSTPFELVKSFNYVTLDLRWAALYDELDAFASIIDRVVNVHLRGRLEGKTWAMDRSNFGFYEALDRIRSKWRYGGLLTVEPEGKIEGSSFSDFLDAMRSLKTPKEQPT